MMAVKNGRAVPPRLLEPVPEVRDGLQIYMDAFWDLCGERQGMGRMSWSARHLWCASKGISGEDENDVHFVLGKMDMAYLEWANKKQKSMAKQKEGKGKKSPLGTIKGKQ